jgi:hypothetical protein
MPTPTRVKKSDIAWQRLLNQQIVASRCATAAEVVTTLGAMQGQDYASALWAIGLRLPASTEGDIEQAIRDRTIVRTWPMRGTLHFVPAADVRWMLGLLTPRVIAGTAARVRQLELDDATFAKAERALVRALQAGQQLTRDDILLTLEQAKISTAGGRGYHILFRLAMQGLICYGPRVGKQQTFVLLDEWLLRTRSLGREEALAELARRFFGGHGPATVQDFVWWSGLKVAEAKAALASVASSMECHRVDGIEYWHIPGQGIADTAGVHLLPAFDEYLLGYKERSAVLDAAHAGKVVPGGNGVFLPMMVRDGHVIGTWKRAVAKDRARVTLLPFAPLTKSALKAFDAAAVRYGEFYGCATTLHV